jgi:DNA (cytosine-5)-methyltransferase 1
MTAELILNIYEKFQAYNQAVDALNKISKKKSRKSNFPEVISEYLVQLCIKAEKRQTGDLWAGNKRIEVKCFSSTGPTSFGPTEKWDSIIFVDARNHPVIIIYENSESNTSKNWQNLPVSSSSTFGDQCKQGRRPRMDFARIQKYIDFKILRKDTIHNIINTCIMENMSISIADFFCGIGGIRMGFQQASPKFQCVFSNDIDKHAITSYQAIFKDTVNSTSIADLKTGDIPDFDIFLGGFPCQSFSIAGNRKGFEDERGQLFFDIIRILREKRPIAFLLENVKNLKTHDNGNTYRIVKKELCSLGYTFKAKIMNSSEYANLPQNRERIFLVGFLHREMTEKFRFPSKIPLTSSVQDYLEKNISSKYYYTEESKIYDKLKTSITKNNVVYQYRRHYVRENKTGVCPTLTANMGLGGHNVPLILDSKGIRKLTPKECFNLQGLTVPNLPIVDSHLYRLAGNSVSTPLIARIAKNMEKVITYYRKNPILVFVD